MKVLVTGATGFLGAHVVRELLHRGYSVMAACRASSDTWRLDAVMESIELVELDLVDTGSVGRVFSRHRPEAVVHCAAYGVSYGESDVDRAVAVNIKGTYELVRAASSSGVSRFIHTGSCFEYGDKDHPVGEGDVPAPTGIYGATKVSATLMALAEAAGSGLELVVVRPFGMWGLLEDVRRLVPQVVRACICNTPLALTGCEQVRDYSHVSDIAGMMVSILGCEDFPSGRILNLGSGRKTVLREFVLKVVRTLGADERLMRFGELPYRPDEMRMLVADTTRLGKYIDIGGESDDLFKQRLSELSQELKDRGFQNMRRGRISRSALRSC